MNAPAALGPSAKDAPMTIGSASLPAFVWPDLAGTTA